VLLLGLLCGARGLGAAEVEVDDLTKRLAQLVRLSERQAGGGDGSEALATLAQAKTLAAKANRPETRQIESRIQRLKEGLARQQKIAEELRNLALAPHEDAEGVPEGLIAKAPEEVAAAPAVSLTQTECVEIALQNNLGLRLQRLTDRRSDFALDDAWAQFLPTIDASLTHSGSIAGGKDTNSTSLGFGVTQRSPWGTTVSVSGAETENHGWTGPSRTSSFGIDVSQPLWRGFGTDVGKFEIRSARLNKLISRGSLELAVQDLIFRTQTAYADCIRQIRNMEVNKRAVKSAQVFLRLTQVREKAGQQTRLDVYNAEVQLADRQLAVISNQRALEQAYDTLKRIMDVDLEEDVGVKSQSVEFGENAPEGEDHTLESDEEAGTVKLVKRKGGKELGEPEVMFQAQHFDDTKVLSEARTNRVDLLNSKRNIALQQLNALLQKDGLGQQVDLTAGYGRSGTSRYWSRTHAFENDEYSIGLNYSIPWGKVRDKSAYKRALLSIEQAEIELKDVSNQVHQEVRNVLRTLREAEKSILIQAKKVEQAKRSVDAERIRFERGLKDSFDVITAEDSLLEAKRSFINRTVEYVVRLDELQLVIGAPTGRVDLSAKTPGGGVRTGLPETLTPDRTPRLAPVPDKTIKDRY